jgi:hypothetical protein
VKANANGMVFDSSKFLEFKDKMLGTDDVHQMAQKTKIGAKKSMVTKKKAAIPSSSGGGKAKSSAPKKTKSKPKELNNVILNIDEALRHEDKLSTKTRPQDIDKIYCALKIGLAICFLYKKNRIPASFHSDRLHIAPDSMKY